MTLDQAGRPAVPSQRPAALSGAPSLEGALESAWRRRRRWDRFWQFVMPLAVAIPVIVIWQLDAHRAGLLVPTFTAFAAAVGKVATGAAFWQALGTSETALVIGYGAAVLIGVPLGFAMGRVGILRLVAAPYLNLTIITPMALVMPIVLMVFGLSLTARVVIIFLFAIGFIVFPIEAGVSTIPRPLQDMCRSYGGSELQMWREILLPGSLPALMTGLRQGLGHALTGMVVAELTLLAVGLGRLILDYEGQFDSASVFAVVLLIIAQAVLLMSVLRVIEGWVRGTYRSQASLH